MYAPQSGLSDEVKDLVVDLLRAVTARIPGSEFLIPCRGWNGHVGVADTGYRDVHAGMAYGRPEPDSESERTLENSLAFNLLLGNTCLRNVTAISPYKSGHVATQIDFILFRKTMSFILFRKTMSKLVKDVKLIPRQEVALQH